MSNFRNYRMDNIRCILIFLVVFGHLSELYAGSIKNIVYTVIYTIHMPCFIFVTGNFARFSPQKILKHILLPYCIFQVLYLLFDFYVIRSNWGGVISFQFTTPYWLLWYLLSVFFYYLSVPFLENASGKQAVAVLVGSVCLSLLVGFDNSVGYYLSLSRTVVFFPFFILGYYCAHISFPAECQLFIQNHKKALTVAVVCVFALCEYVLYMKHVPVMALYGSYSYASAGSSARMRLAIGGCAFWGILCAMLVVPNKKITLISSIGAHTFPIYLFHGFVQRLLAKYDVFCYTQKENLVLACCISGIVLLVFGSKPLARMLKKVC